MKKKSSILLWVMAVIIGVIPGIVALLQEASKNTVGKYYLATIIIVVVLWLLVKRITRSREAI